LDSVPLTSLQRCHLSVTVRDPLAMIMLKKFGSSPRKI
jgi:hypothetical protein